ncbi:MAG: ATP synthase F1 subunit epsilon [Candidatus Sungbacteria bacterium]|nr:ATP synthase F1 subunit epsilon [bacterium]MDZ4260056.1 ATP synthase F1 subunit epsilon [Candidatus Sungbacteria bacterium]
MRLSIYSIKKTLFEGTVERVIIPTPQGQITVLDNHIPLVTLVKNGMVRYHSSDNQWHDIEFSGGIAEVRPGSECVLLAQEEA